LFVNFIKRKCKDSKIVFLPQYHKCGIFSKYGFIAENIYPAPSKQDQASAILSSHSFDRPPMGVRPPSFSSSRFAY
jgi:hypothetical protein